MGLRGSFFTLQNLYRAAVTDPSDLAVVGQSAGVMDGIQNVLVNVASNGYTTSASTLKKGIRVRLTLKTNNTGGCARAFTIPELNISKVLPSTGEDTVEFTPKKTGRLAYSCSMGMYTGAFTVID
jgi:plastocyanin domain-containing protein